MPTSQPHDLSRAEHWELALVYDPETGRVIHQHEVITWPGGKHPSREEIEREALEQAGRHRERPLGRTAILHTDPRKLRAEALHRVDPALRTVVEEPLPPRRKRRP